LVGFTAALTAGFLGAALALTFTPADFALERDAVDLCLATVLAPRPVLAAALDAFTDLTGFEAFEAFEAFAGAAFRGFAGTLLGLFLALLAAT
jgi:hypothetical protein